MLVLIENATAVFKESEEDDGGGGRCYIIKTQTGFHGVLVILPEQWKTLLLISGEEKPNHVHDAVVHLRLTIASKLSG